ncbi:hypothetical protein ACLWBD_10160 [Bdellovibrio sp. HCB117]|uniref:hypothetical protein n=1 Tax=Bdellovibrio sp. HCB117 TaxID=3394359 RepID=UPI0039B6E279
MFKKILILMVLCFSSSAAMANPNPWMRVCRIAEGFFQGLVVEGTKDQFLWTCSFDNSFVGADEFFVYKTDKKIALSLNAYLSGVSSTASSCESLNATTVRAEAISGQMITMCQFADGSLLDLSSLKSGYKSPLNSKLDRGLN